MPTVFLSPLNETTFFIPGGNTPANGGQLFVYQAGSSTKVTVYKDSGGTVQHTNPIVLNSGGSPPNNSMIWIPTGTVVDLVLAPSNDTDPPASPYWTKEDLSGVNDVTTQEWIAGPAPTFVNASTFTMNGDQTNTFKTSRRLKFTVTAGTVYGSIGSVALATGSTTVNGVFTSTGVLDSGLTAVSYSLIDVSPASINADYIHKKATAVPSSATTNIWGVDGDYVHITGTTAISHFSSAPYAGAERDIIFDSTPTLVSSGSISIPGVGNLTASANDRAKVRAETTSTHTITFYQKALQAPVMAMSLIASTVAASSATIDFNNLSTYVAYVAQLVNVVPQTNNTDLWIRFSSSNGASYSSTNGYDFGAANLSSSNVFGQAGSSAAIAGIIANSVSNIAGFGVSGPLNVGLGVINTYSGTPSYRQGAGGSSYAATLSGGRDTGHANGNSMRFMFSSGNINAGMIYLYGVRG